MRILVTGGCGYIGSHCVRQLLEAGHDVVVVDDLSYGHKRAIPPSIPLYEMPIGDRQAMEAILVDEAIELVMHFAAYINVGESVQHPDRYWHNNFVQTLSLLEAMRSADVMRMVFSSTCAIFGTPEQLPLSEDLPKAPINPYGASKLAVEHALTAYAKAYGLSFAALRYFNACGAAPGGEIGEDHSPETHIIPLILQVALGQREQFHIYGNDYPTPDGTCLRDYVHVDDLVSAHLATFEKLLSGTGVALYYNLGTGEPYSVLEVIQTAERVTGQPIPYTVSPRRAGDPAQLYADKQKAQAELNWTPVYTDIDDIISSAWAWHKQQNTA